VPGPAGGRDETCPVSTGGGVARLVSDRVGGLVVLGCDLRVQHGAARLRTRARTGEGRDVSG